MHWTSNLSEGSGKLIAWLLVALLLTLIVVLSGCAQPRPPSPPVLWKPAKIMTADKDLMTPPLPSGKYLESVRESLSRWDNRLKTSASGSEGSKPTQTQP